MYQPAFVVSRMHCKNNNNRLNKMWINTAIRGRSLTFTLCIWNNDISINHRSIALVFLLLFYINCYSTFLQCATNSDSCRLFDAITIIEFSVTLDIHHYSFSLSLILVIKRAKHAYSCNKIIMRQQYFFKNPLYWSFFPFRR